MTLKVEDPPLVLTTLNEEWANKINAKQKHIRDVEF